LKVSGSIVYRNFLQNMLGHFLNKKIKNKLQRYQIMRFKVVDKFVYNGASVDLLKQSMEDVQIDGIISLCLSLSHSAPKLCTNVFITKMIAKILPNLQKIDFSNSMSIFGKSNFNYNTVGIFLDGTAIRSSINLKKSIWTIQFSATTVTKKKITCWT
jgi:hypothetical protein